MIQRGGQVVINLMANVKQKTIKPFIKDTIVPDTLVVTAHLGRTLPSRERGGSQRQERGRRVFADRGGTSRRQVVEHVAALLAQGGDHR